MQGASPAEALVAHYENCFKAHGRMPKGVDWPNLPDLEKRFEVMLGVLPPGKRRPSLLDLGCGPGLLVDYLDRTGRLSDIAYHGIDLSEPMLESARAHWPNLEFQKRDVLLTPLPTSSFDCAILNGVLTERRAIPEREMKEYAIDLLSHVFEAVRWGIAFNVMSKIVDWERDDLFHWGFDDMARAVSKALSRHLVIRADYGLYEYTVYVYRQPKA
jgi:SAM-dependent methyltransferase